MTPSLQHLLDQLDALESHHREHERALATFNQQLATTPNGLTPTNLVAILRGRIAGSRAMLRYYALCREELKDQILAIPLGS